MRITGGECRGRTISAPEGLDIRPTASKIRQAFFNILSNIVEEGRFVDVCAGTGLMGFEALSRGWQSLIAIEENRAFAQAIEGNAVRLGFKGVVEVIRGDAKRVLPLLHEGEADVIFADPPYRTELANAVLRLTDQHGLLRPEGILILEHRNELKLPESQGRLYLSDRRKYGQTTLSFYKGEKLQGESVEIEAGADEPPAFPG